MYIICGSFPAYASKYDRQCRVLRPSIMRLSAAKSFWAGSYLQTPEGLSLIGDLL